MSGRSEGATLLRQWLKNQGRTQFELCAEIGAQPSVLYGWLSGRTRPCLRHALRLERLAGIAPRLWMQPHANQQATA